MTTAATRIIRPLMHAALLLAASAQAQTPACDQFKAVLATRLHSDVQGYTMDSVPSNIAVPPGAEELTLAEHERIVDAIAAHDPQAASEAMRAHLTRANTMYQQLLRPL